MTDYEDKHKRLQQAWQTLEADRARLTAINVSLPVTVDEKARLALKTERLTLQGEIASLPEEIGELARLFALADLAQMAEDLTAKTAQLEAAWPGLVAIRERWQAILRQIDTHNRNDPYRRANPEAHAEQAARLNRERAAIELEAKPLEALTFCLEAEIRDLRSQPAIKYKGARLAPGSWPKAAHDYGELCQKTAQSGG